VSTFWQAATELEALAIPFVVVTLARARGHVPQEEGAKAIVTATGLAWGTVGGGKVEARAIRQAQELLADPSARQNELVTWNLQRDIGMTCGGETTYFFEKHSASAWKIAIFGAGHVSQALVRVLEKLDCQITCIDARPEWIVKLPTFPQLIRSVNAEPASAVAALDPETYFVVMTRGHETDRPIIDQILCRHPKAPYLGVMGSDVKALKLREELSDLGHSKALISLMNCPIGFKFGGNTPEEIAITVACQLMQAKDLHQQRIAREKIGPANASPVNA
jgi:xanthine dehydrogenase accessory factor